MLKEIVLPDRQEARPLVPASGQGNARDLLTALLLCQN